MITTVQVPNYKLRFGWNPEDVKTVTMAALQNHAWATKDAAQKATLRALMTVVKKANAAEKTADRVTFSVKIDNDGQATFTSPYDIYTDINILVSLDTGATNAHLYDGQIILQNVIAEPTSTIYTLHNSLLEIRRLDAAKKAAVRAAANAAMNLEGNNA